MLLFDNKNKCCGCSACYNICPVNAIEMLADEEGFEYPSIDANKCVECGLCKKVCQFHPDYDKDGNFETPVVYALKHKSDDIRKNSRSGGAFMAFAEYIISKGGVVYGVTLDESLVPKHICVDKVEDLYVLQGSKYVEAEIGDTFKRVEDDLKKGKNVLFASTACKIAGLKSYIKNKKLHKNLITIGLICHGVPSRMVFKDYIEYQNKMFFSKIKSFNFRDKSFGWNTHLESFVLQSNKKVVSSMYRNIFYSEYTLRPSCYECVYTNKKRPEDITLGDFWKIENIYKDFNDNNGVSCVILNSSKAVDLYNCLRHNVIDLKCSINDCNHVNLKKSSKKPDDRVLFWNVYENKGFIKALESVFGKFFGLKMTLKSYIRMIKK